MTAILVRKLEHYVPLTGVEKQSLLQAEIAVRDIDARADIVREQDGIEGAVLLLEGFACRYKLLPDGRRQIVSYMVPGDMCDPRVFFLDRRDHSIASISRATIAIMSRKTVFGLTSLHPRIARGFWWCSLVDEAIAREWLVSLGQRTAIERLSHLIGELYVRLKAVDLVHGDAFDFPVTQAELGDTLGLSAVHVNRTLQDMRRNRLIRMAGKRVTVLDFEALATVGMFKPDYLHYKAKQQLSARPAQHSGRAGVGGSRFMLQSG